MQERMSLAATIGGAYTMARAARSLGEARNRGESDVEYLTRAIQPYVNDPSYTEQMVRRAAWGLGATHPDAYNEMLNTMQRAAGFLNSKLPQTSTDPFDTTSQQPISKSQEHSLQGYVEAIWKPSKILDELKDGTLQKETIEAVKAVYPDFYDELRGLVMNQIAERKPKLDYYRKLDLALLFDVRSMQGIKDLAAIQTAHAQTALQEQQIEQGSAALPPSRRPTKSRTAGLYNAGSTGLLERRAKA
jgi:hypothetical protein